MSSTYTVFPSQFLDGGRPDRMHDQRNVSVAAAPHQEHHHHQNKNQSHQSHQSHQHVRPSTPAADAASNGGIHHHLSPFSANFQSTSASSPNFHNSNPSAESTPGSVQYQSSDFSSEVDDDPFYGIDFSNIEGGSASFLALGVGIGLNGSATNGVAIPFATTTGDDPFSVGSLASAQEPQEPQEPQHYNHHASTSASNAHANVNGQDYLISPEQTPSMRTVSPQSERQGPSSAFPSALPEAALHEDHKRPVKATKRAAPQPQFTPETSSIPSSDDGVAPSIPAMSAQSPRINVSLWSKDAGDEEGLQNIGSAFHLDLSAINPGPVPTATIDDPYIQPLPQRAASDSGADVSRDDAGRWNLDTSTGQRGLDPSSRPQGETTSANELAAHRAVRERNQEVDQWLSTSAHGSSRTSGESDNRPTPQSEGVSDREVSLGHETTNVMQAGRTYFVETGGSMTQEDLDIMRQNRFWDDSPAVLPISAEGAKHFQPETSQAAIQKFDAMCRDNDSIVSRAATWGTRRRSLPSILDIEGITSGNFLKKLSISRGEPRKPNVFFKELRGLVRKPSATGLASSLKRSFSSQDDDLGAGGIDPNTGERRESRDSLHPPSRAMSWKRHPTPSINTALVGMGSNIAAIGTTHARSGSISTTTPVASPKSPFTLKVANTLNRRRSKSELPKLGTENSFSNIADMWKRSGGPPIGALAKPAGAAGVFERDEDEEEEDDELDDGDMKMESTKLIEDIAPNFAGFQQHILRLNPTLADKNGYLVDRIAHQQIVRYKSLLNARVKHLGHIRDRDCQCGSMCIALGGSAVMLDSRGGGSVADTSTRGLDPLSARLDGSDGDVTPLEGAIAQESFPQDIPMPPTQTLPAEFECQLCFQAKKFQKPSDWTKHVHEDVQPFTCTWDRCRDPKIFKRKADWVRHENEGHRHLEWWTCDVEECRHTCYRRDNFLQHLVREHKFTEPKVKTKAAIKRSGGQDPTWQKVERCHAETQARPQDEPCRFCGKAFPTWKKLTVHLAKHMEQISLPILRLVARRDLEPDTIISPVQEPPQRPFVPLPPPPPPQVKQEPMGPQQQQQAAFGQSPNGPRHHSPGSHHMQAQHQQYATAVTSPFVSYPVPSPGGGGVGPVVAGSSYPAFHHPQPHGPHHAGGHHPHHMQAVATSHYDPHTSLAAMPSLDTTVMGWSHVDVSPAVAVAQQGGFAMGIPVTTTGAAVSSPYVSIPQHQHQQSYLPVSAVSATGPTGVVASSGLEPFPQLPMAVTTDGLQYDGLMDPSVATGVGGVGMGVGIGVGVVPGVTVPSQGFVPSQGVTAAGAPGGGPGGSPYNRSPHQQQTGNFY